jgi:uncharacterized membrane protein
MKGRRLFEASLGPQPLQTRSAAPAWLAFTPGLFVFLWATGFIGARLSADNAEPFSFLFVRCLIVAAILTVAAIAFRAPWPGGAWPSTPWWWARSSTAAISASSSGPSTMACPPAFRRLSWAAAAADGADCRPGAGRAHHGAPLAGARRRHSRGRARGVAQAHIWRSRHHPAHGGSHQKRHVTGLDLRSGNVLQFLGAAIAVGLIALLTESFEITWTGEVVFAMAWLVLVLSLGATTLLYLMIRHGEVSRIAGLFYLVPAVTAAIAWILFDETLSPVQILGMAVCAGAVMLVTRRA